MRRIALVAVLLFSACTSSESDVRRVLEDEGYMDVEVGGYAWFGCGRDDEFRNHFRARRGGRVVEGVVCCGWLKDCTVRH